MKNNNKIRFCEHNIFPITREERLRRNIIARNMIFGDISRSGSSAEQRSQFICSLILFSLKYCAGYATCARCIGRYIKYGIQYLGARVC